MCTCAQVRGYMCAYGVVSVSDAYVWGVSVCVVRERRLIVKLHTAVCIDLQRKKVKCCKLGVLVNYN